MNTQLGSTTTVVSGYFAHPSAAPVVGRSLAGRDAFSLSPCYKVSPMVTIICLNKSMVDIQSS